MAGPSPAGVGDFAKELIVTITIDAPTTPDSTVTPANPATGFIVVREGRPTFDLRAAWLAATPGMSGQDIVRKVDELCRHYSRPEGTASAEQKASMSFGFDLRQEDGQSDKAFARARKRARQARQTALCEFVAEATIMAPVRRTARMVAERAAKFEAARLDLVGNDEWQTVVSLIVEPEVVDLVEQPLPEDATESDVRQAQAALRIAQKAMSRHQHAKMAANRTDQALRGRGSRPADQIRRRRDRADRDRAMAKAGGAGTKGGGGRKG